jgi:hypothetical protein
VRDAASKLLVAHIFGVKRKRSLMCTWSKTMKRALLIPFFTLIAASSGFSAETIPTQLGNLKLEDKRPAKFAETALGMLGRFQVETSSDAIVKKIMFWPQVVEQGMRVDRTCGFGSMEEGFDPSHCKALFAGMLKEMEKKFGPSQQKNEGKYEAAWNAKSRRLTVRLNNFGEFGELVIVLERTNEEPAIHDSDKKARYCSSVQTKAAGTVKKTKNNALPNEVRATSARDCKDIHQSGMPSSMATLPSCWNPKDDSISIDLNGDGTNEYIVCCNARHHGDSTMERVFAKINGKWVIIGSVDTMPKWEGDNHLGREYSVLLEKEATGAGINSDCYENWSFVFKEN